MASDDVVQMSDEDMKALGEGGIWLPKREILANYRIPHRHLAKMVKEGWVRTVKFSEPKQSRRVYCVADVETVLEKLSLGQRPNRKAGKSFVVDQKIDELPI
jgi:hypothetical protein